MVEMARAEMDLPHIVFSRDARGGMDSFSGPYATAIEALVAADVEQQIEREAAGDHTMTFHIAALYPALGVGLDGS
jgi:F420-dependent methylenetetrahydromethanopterin dehydrogenase